jgi:HTH-type transcriptional regulator/antitoxin HigA
LQVVGALAGHQLNADQEDYLEAVGHFLDEYDRAARPQLPRADGLSVLRGLLEDRGFTGVDLSRILGGSRNLGAMILRGERRLTADHIRALAAYFGVSPSVLI